MNSFVAGVDCHKDTHTVVVLNSSGQMVREFAITPEPNGYAVTDRARVGRSFSLCDEYQQVCTAGDGDFFDTSQALGVIVIVASQSIEPYIAAIGSEHAATALLGNFANVIAFRSMERAMNYVAGKLGEVVAWKETYNTGRADKPTYSSRKRPQYPKETRPQCSASGSSRPRNPYR